MVMDVVGLIVTYRSRLEDVREAAESFLNTPLSVHLTVVDNDSGQEYFSALHQALPNEVHIISSGRNGGFGFGNNIGLRHIPPSRYVLFLNPDVVVHEGTLASLAAYMDSHPDVGVVSPKVLYPDGALQPLNKRDPAVFDLFLRRFAPGLAPRRMARYTMQDAGYDRPCDVEFMTGCFMLVRREALEKVGGFDERFFLYLEDADLTRRIRAFARAMYVPDVSITHRWQRGSHRSWRLMLVMLHSIWVYFSKWGWRWW
jgi:GT2 family glycosyltransferase